MLIDEKGTIEFKYFEIPIAPDCGVLVLK